MLRCCLIVVCVNLTGILHYINAPKILHDFNKAFELN